MKAITKVFLAAAVMSGTLSFRTSRDGDALTIETTVSNPAAMIETAGALISVAGDVLHSFEQADTGQPEADALYCASADMQVTATDQQDTPTIYRIRNAAGDAGSQLGAYYDLTFAKQSCPAGYCVFDAQDRLIYTGGQG